MVRRQHQILAGALAIGAVLACGVVSAHDDNDRRNDRREDRRRDDRRDGRLKTVFVVAMENHNWTQPASTTSPQAEFQNAYAPYINSLINGTAGISDQVSYANNYINSGVGVHPSEPNYIWMEAGTNFGVFNDNNPYKNDCTPDTVQTTDQHLTAFLDKRHVSWKSYQEDTDVDLTTNQPLAPSAWTVPLFSSISGSFTTGVNAYNYTHQFNYAAKHNPMVFFTDTNGGCNTTNTNPRRTQYAPLQQFVLDLQNDDVADYNWITPNQFNDQHTSLTGGYGGIPASDDRSKIAQGDNFLARIVPLIMTSKAYKDGGVILLWWDESEGGDSTAFTLPFIVISKDVRPNVSGLPFASATQFSHSSTLRTLQEIFDVDPDDGFGWLGSANAATDLRGLFKPGVIK